MHTPLRLDKHTICRYIERDISTAIYYRAASTSQGKASHDSRHTGSTASDPEPDHCGSSQAFGKKASSVIALFWKWVWRADAKQDRSPRS